MAESENTAPKSGLMTLIKAAAILSVLVIVQVVAAAFIIPSPQETEQLARDIVLAKQGDELTDALHDEPSEAETQEQEQDLVEVSLGQFSITRYNVQADKTFNIEFEVYGTVLAAEHDEYNSIYETNKNRIREQINMTIHSAEPADLTDKGLGLIKRRILERTNRALGKPLVHEVLLTQFNFVQR